MCPPGVLNVVSGGDELGAWMTSHPGPRKISFTGSIETGKLVAAAAAPDLKRVTLELGGNDPAIILDDADPAAVVDGIFGGAFANNGQICSAIKRVYVPERLYDDVVDALATRAWAIKVGVGTDPESQARPHQQRPPVRAGIGAGGRRAWRTGPKRWRGASPWTVPATSSSRRCCTDITDGVRIVDEEQFGPALPCRLLP